jgi:hypothetical protein
MTSENTTGTIRSTLAAAPQRDTVPAAKATIFVAVFTRIAGGHPRDSPSVRAQPRGSGHRVVKCRAPGCDLAWYGPWHDPGSGGGAPGWR